MGASPEFVSLSLNSAAVLRPGGSGLDCRTRPRVLQASTRFSLRQRNRGKRDACRWVRGKPHDSQRQSAEATVFSPLRHSRRPPAAPHRPRRCAPAGTWSGRAVRQSCAKASGRRWVAGGRWHSWLPAGGSALGRTEIPAAPHGCTGTAAVSRGREKKILLWSYILVSWYIFTICV